MFELVSLNLSASCMLHALTKASSSSETEICFQSFLTIFFQRVAYQDPETAPNKCGVKSSQMWGANISFRFSMFYPGSWGRWSNHQRMGGNLNHQRQWKAPGWRRCEEKGQLSSFDAQVGLGCWKLEFFLFVFFRRVGFQGKKHEWKTLYIDWWLVVSSFMVHLKIWTWWLVVSSLIHGFLESFGPL